MLGPLGDLQGTTPRRRVSVGTVIIQYNIRKKKDLLTYANKLIEKIPNPSKTK